MDFYTDSLGSFCQLCIIQKGRVLGFRIYIRAPPPLKTQTLLWDIDKCFKDSESVLKLSPRCPESSSDTVTSRVGTLFIDFVFADSD